MLLWIKAAFSRDVSFVFRAVALSVASNNVFVAARSLQNMDGCDTLIVDVIAVRAICAICASLYQMIGVY